MICEVAVATRTNPNEWLDADPDVIATVIEILEKQAKKVERR